MSQYVPTKHTNLRRRATSGEYVLFAKIGTKLHREGLNTKNEELALLRRDERIAEIRRTLFAQKDKFDARLTLRDFIATRLDQIEVSIKRFEADLKLLQNTVGALSHHELDQ